jgi:hypothetical protein
MAKLIYQRPADQMLDSGVTITPSAEDSAYPRANLYDSNPAKAFKLNATSGNIVFNFGTATNIDIFAIIHHNLDAGLGNVRIQGHTSDSWGAPTLNELITIPTYELGSPPWPVNPFIDLSGIANSFQYWRLVFGTANSVNIQLGQLWFGETKRELTHNVSWGYQEGVERRIIEHETDYGVSAIYDLGAKIKTWSPEIKTSDAGMALVEQWWDSCNGRSLPSLIVFDPDVNDARLVRFTEPSRLVQRDFVNDNTIRFGLREVSRGLVF